MEPDHPARLVLVCRVLPVNLADGRAWPWAVRKRRLLKALLRAWGLVVEEHNEIRTEEGKEGHAIQEADGRTAQDQALARAEEPPRLSAP